MKVLYLTVLERRLNWTNPTAPGRCVSVQYCAFSPSVAAMR